MTEYFAWRRVLGLVLSVVGFLLSPLSWWNDLLINLPIAYVFAIPFSLISKDFLLPALIVGYWITNIVGLLLMHYGVSSIIRKNSVSFTKSQLIQHVILTCLYTGIVIIAISTGLVSSPFS